MTTETTPFRTDNTEGYTQDELDQLNQEWLRRGGDQVTNKSERDHLAESILRDYDSGAANR